MRAGRAPTAMSSIFADHYLADFKLTRAASAGTRGSAPARIVNVASIGQRPVNFDDVMMKNNFTTANA